MTMQIKNDKKELKTKGAIWYLRAYLQTNRNLSDPESRLLLVYECICDWDRKHKYFGTADINLERIKEFYLPNWSTGKISTCRNSLVVKGRLVRFGKSRFGIPNAEIFYRKQVRAVEKGWESVRPSPRRTEDVFRRAEKGLQSIEGDLWKYEEEGFSKLPDLRKNKQKTTPEPEESASLKETLKKDKENIENNFINQPWNDPIRGKLLKGNAKRKNSSNL